MRVVGPAVASLTRAVSAWDAWPRRKRAGVRQRIQRLRSVWPEMREMLWRNRSCLLLGLLLVAGNRAVGLVLPMSTKVFMDTVIGRGEGRLLAPLVLAVLCATCIQGLTSFALNQVLAKAAQRLIAELRCKVHAHITGLGIAFYDNNKTGVLVSRIMNDVEGVRHLVGTGLVEFVGGAMGAGFVLFVLLSINVQLTLIAFGVLAGFALILRRMLATMRPIFRERSRITAEVTGRLSESLSGVRIVKSYQAEPYERRVFEAGTQKLLCTALRSVHATSMMSLSVTVLMGLVTSLVLFVSARDILSGQMTLGDFAAFSALLAYLVGPVIQIASVGTQLNEAVAGLERTREVLSEKPEAADPRRTVTLGRLRAEVEFDNVSFAYDSARTVLENVSFHATPGSVTALVGPSGSGKSTVIGLLASFYSPTSGAIRADGVDLSTGRLDSYRAQLGIVPQDTFLFDGTIRENVAFARPQAPEAAILDACRVARVDEFAEKLPDGYDTVVGERGVKLSGGQRQRVSIARAILADPRILILDEATSSLDSESEALIQEGLRYLKGGRTTFVIAHRFSTIRDADQILVFEHGRVVERGTHAELQAKKGRYYELSSRDRGPDAGQFSSAGKCEHGEPEPAGPSMSNAVSAALLLFR